MALFTFETLVLRGVSVLVDGTAVNVRLGFGVEASADLGAIAHPMRHPSTNPQPVCAQPADTLDCPITDRIDESVVGGTGRSRGARSPRFAALRAERSVLSRIVNKRRTLSTFPTGRCAGRGKCQEGRLAWFIPASRTPPTSTRGTRDR